MAAENDFPFLSRYQHLPQLVNNYVRDTSLTILRTLTDIPDEILELMKFHPLVEAKEVKCMLIFYLSSRKIDDDGPNIFTNNILPHGEYDAYMKNIRKLSENETQTLGVESELEKMYRKYLKTTPDFEYSTINIDSSKISVGFNGVTPVELFEKMIINWNIPLCSMKWKGRDVVKLYSGIETDPRWVDLITKISRDDDSILLSFVINNIPEGEKYSYTSQENLTLGTVTRTGNGYLLRYEYVTKYGIDDEKMSSIINKTFPHPSFTSVKKETESICANAIFKKLPFDKATFSDFVFMDKVASKVVFFNENSNSSTNKKRYHLYLFKTFNGVYDPELGILTTIIKKYTDAEIRMKNVASIETFRKYLAYMNRLFVIYTATKHEIEAYYEKQLGTSISKFLENEEMDGEKINKKEGERMREMKRVMSANPGRTYDDLFNQVKDKHNRGWSVDCAPEKHPYILTDENREQFEGEKAKFLQDMTNERASAVEINKAASVLSKEWNEYEFACIPRRNEKEASHVAVRFNERTGEPCCASLKVATKDVSIVEKFDPKVLAINKKLDYGRMGMTKPHEINRLLKLVHTNPEWYARYNVGSTDDTFLRCIVLATSPNEFLKYTSEQLPEKLAPHKSKIKIDDTSYINPDMWITTLSNVYKVNIVLFEMEPNNLSASIYTPPSYPDFDDTKPCVIVCTKPRSDTDPNKICELIVKSGTVPQFTFTSDKDADMWAMLKDVVKLAVKKYVVW
jgi:hypothetical protein